MVRFPIHLCTFTAYLHKNVLIPKRHMYIPAGDPTSAPSTLGIPRWGS